VLSEARAPGTPFAREEAAAGLTLAIPSQALEAIASRAAEIMLERGKEESPWLTRKEAANYLRVPLSRLEKDRTLPSHRWDGRVLYNRAELDEYLLGLAAA
jgi:excisionase family DNA binding protein